MLCKRHPKRRDITIDIQVICLSALLDFFEYYLDKILQVGLHTFLHRSLPHLPISGLPLRMIKRDRKGLFGELALFLTLSPTSFAQSRDPRWCIALPTYPQKPIPRGHARPSLRS